MSWRVVPMLEILPNVGEHWRQVVSEDDPSIAFRVLVTIAEDAPPNVQVLQQAHEPFGTWVVVTIWPMSLLSAILEVCQEARAPYVGPSVFGDESVLEMKPLLEATQRYEASLDELRHDMDSFEESLREIESSLPAGPRT